MAEIRINATGGLKLYDADDSHYAQILAGTITSNTDVMTLGHAAVVMGTKLDMNGNNLVLDADADTYLDGGTADDVVDVYVAGAKDWKFGANSINVLSGTTLTIDSGATITNSGTANGFGSADPASADGDTLGTASLEWSDLFLADGGIIKFGNDQDTLLTHTDGTGLTLNSTNKLTFGDAATYINQSSDGVMTIAGEATIDLTASTAVLVSNDLKLDSDAAVLAFGADSEVTVTHSADTGLILKHTATGASKPINLTLQTGETNIDQNDVIGGIFFQAPDEAAGTDAILVAAGIRAVCDTADFAADSNATRLEFHTGESATANNKMSVRANGDVNINAGNINMSDDYGVVFGGGADWHIGAGAGESKFHVSLGSSVVTDQGWSLEGMANNSTAVMSLIAGEGYGPGIHLKQDQGDDNADNWLIGQHATDGSDSTQMYFTDYDSGSWDIEMGLLQSGVLNVEGAVNASTTVDYAEFFEWKTELASDEAVINAYGLTVVLDDDKVRLAEAGEEADVLGVVRPNDTSAMVGGNQTFQWKDRYLTDVWGQTQYEQYTLVDWDETITELYEEGDEIPEGKNVGDVKRTYMHHHKYHKDRIPAKKLKPEIQLNQSEHNWHTLAGNLTADDLFVPTTDEEKAAANYTERNTYRRNKGEHSIGDPLMRKKINPSYVSSQAYLPRDKRRKEWCVVGLLGQVPVRDTAIVSTQWKLMKNLESGIDLYYIK